jgi:signal transduction histidine kinase
LENEAQEAIGELRVLVHGFQPPVLTDFGLVHALHDISRSLPISVSMVTQGVRRYDNAIEDAVFFTCREALQNTIKHAPSATGIMVTLIDKGDRLDFGVDDNGHGFDAVLPGTGSATMHHRIEALGGSLTIRWSPGVGTSVQRSIPLR